MEDTTPDYLAMKPRGQGTPPDILQQHSAPVAASSIPLRTSGQSTA